MAGELDMAVQCTAVNRAGPAASGAARARSHAALQFLLCLRMRSRLPSPGWRWWRNAISTLISFWRTGARQIGQRCEVTMSFWELTPLDSLMVLATTGLREKNFGRGINCTADPPRSRSYDSPFAGRKWSAPVNATEQHPGHNAERDHAGQQPGGEGDHVDEARRGGEKHHRECTERALA